MINAILAGLFLGLALVFSVGPVIFTIIKLRINYGLKSAFYFIAGVWISDLILVIGANFFGNLLSKLITHKVAIGISGGCFLIGLGLFYLFIKRFTKNQQLEDGIKISGTKNIRLLITGFLINTLNPSVIALWIAASTNTIYSPADEKFAMFAICLLLNMGADIAKIYLSGKLKNKLTEKNIGVINKISGLLFIAFGAALIISVL
jgi:threonine/homoserine/homoserine lactone efflux protein